MIVASGIDLPHHGGLKRCGSDGAGRLMVRGVVDGDFRMGIPSIRNVASEVRPRDPVVVTRARHRLQEPAHHEVDGRAVCRRMGSDVDAFPRGGAGIISSLHWALGWYFGASGEQDSGS